MSEAWLDEDCPHRTVESPTPEAYVKQGEHACEASKDTNWEKEAAVHRRSGRRNGMGRGSQQYLTKKVR